MKDNYVSGKKTARNSHKMAICPVAKFGDQSLPTEMLFAIINRKLARLQKKQRKSVQIRQTIKSFTAIIWATRFKLISMYYLS